MMEDYTIQQHYQQPSFIEARIDTDKLLRRVYEYLSGVREITQSNPDGTATQQFIQVSTPIANQEGIYGILSMIDIRINPQTVQGNFERDDYEEYKYNVRVNLLMAIIKNASNWGVRDESIEKIIDDIMDLLIPFMSRLLKNKERESYESHKSSEIVRGSRDGKGVFNVFNRGNNE